MSRAAFCAAMAALFLSAGAHAEVRMQASLGKLNATLVDLDPNDGIAPSIAFDPVPLDRAWIPYSAELSVNTNMQGGGSQYVYGVTPDLRLRDEVLGRASLDLSLKNRSEPLQTTIDLSLYLSNDDRDYQSAFARAMSDQFSYVLAPRTSVVFSMPGWSSVELDNGVLERFSGESIFSAELRSANGVLVDSVSQSFTFETPDGWEARPYALDRDFSLSVLLSNPSDQAWYGVASFSSLVSAGTVPLPVPEPASMGTLVAGLALLGWRRRRRQ